LNLPPEPILMDKKNDLLTLFQITDSFFPSGSFAYSWGLETYVHEGMIRTRQELQKFLEAYFVGFIAQGDAVILKLSWEAAQKEDLGSLIRLDRLTHSLKLAKELREGSLHTGRQILKVMSGIRKMLFLERYAEGVDMGRAWGHHPVVFGMVCGIWGIYQEDSVLAYLYQSLSALVSAGVRLIPLGHMDGQRSIEEMKPLIQRISKNLVEIGEGDISTFAPGLEIRSMRHEHLYTRLFKA